MDKKLFMAMYDVRGIQNYVFKTNAIKEIIGGSLIIADLIIDAFNEAVKDLNGNQNVPDHTTDFTFFDDTNKDYEIMYYGGGNLLVLYRKNTIDEVYEINQKMAKYIIEHSYSLSLASAVVEISSQDTYKDDYDKLRDEMDKIKDNMIEVTPADALPIVITDEVSGYPLSCQYKDKFSKTQRVRKVSYETKLKLDKCNSFIDNEEKKHKADHTASVFYQSLKNNTFGTQEGENQLAIVHIDGNSIGSSITNIISKAKNYKDAVMTMRIISDNIRDTFENKGLTAVYKQLNTMYKEAEIPEDKRNKQLFRTIIKAGDDITFICNARIALRCVETFINTIKQYKIYDVESCDYFSACAGISIFHTHFPFYVGYKLSEALCESAKKKAKANKNNGKVGNYVDFHICYSGVIGDLETIRNKNYYVNQRNLLIRPYSLDQEDKDQIYYIQNFYKALNSFNANLARSKSKELRDAYYRSEQHFNIVLNRIKSRDLNDEIPSGNYFIKDHNVLTAKYFDALEFLDLHWETKKEEPKDEVNH